MAIKAWLIADATASPNKGYKVLSLAGQTGQTMTVPLYQHYGFSSMPKADSEIIVLERDGAMAAIAEDDAYRPAIDPGDVMLYVDDHLYVKIEDGGDILLVNGDATVSIKADRTIRLDNTEGSVEIDGDTGQVNINAGNLTVDK